MYDDAELHEQKKALRMRMNAFLRSLDPAVSESWGRDAARHVLSLHEYRESHIVLAFLSMPGEIPTGVLVDESLAAGKSVAVPRMEHSPENGDHLAFIILPEDWKNWPRDRFGIPEPPAGTVPISEARLRSSKTFILTPGLAFDRSGRRLGRGKGYYDRFLASLRSGQAPGIFACGFCFSRQLVESVPCGPFDIPVDIVVSEKGTMEGQAAKKSS